MRFHAERTTNGVRCTVTIYVEEAGSGQPHYYFNSFGRREEIVKPTHLLRVGWRASRGEKEKDGNFEVLVSHSVQAAHLLDQLLNFDYQLCDAAIKELQ